MPPPFHLISVFILLRALQIGKVSPGKQARSGPNKKEISSSVCFPVQDGDLAFVEGTRVAKLWIS